MSSEGRRRLIFSVLKTMAVVASLSAVAWGGLGLAEALKAGPVQKSAAVQGVPLKDIVLVTDGVLDQAWINRALALPKNASLMSLDLFALRDRLLVSGQVRSAALTRNFPATLMVTLSERMPMARLQLLDDAGAPRMHFVARDGVVFEGVGLDPKMVETLPWLAGVKLTRQGGRFLPVEGMESVSDLLAKAKLEAEHLYATWTKVSLARLSADGEIEVGTKDGVKIIFGTTEDFFRQLANLDAILDAAKTQPDKAPRLINLAVGGSDESRRGDSRGGWQIPVTFENVATQEPTTTVGGVRPALSGKTSVLPRISQR